IAELAGLKYSENLQGKDISRTLDDPEYKVRDTVFSVSLGGSAFLLRTEKWAYLQYDEDAGSGMELFDMERDPHQFTNLAYNVSYATIVMEFREALKRKLKTVRTNDLDIDYNKK
ncbi:MAG: iduronate-2-sulfatase, partial [Flavobacteriaceae bacterium]|nr:iduronate-2-sulfatase [Flavobacteriaceae bacterium]